LAFALVSLFSSASVALAQDASVTRISPFPHPGVTQSKGPVPLTYPSDTVFVPLAINTKTLLEGWTEYNPNTCVDISTGSYTAPTAPLYGKNSYAVLDGTLTSGPCTGSVFPFDVAYYTWTKKTAAAPQDFFSLQWTTPDGMFVEDSDWLAELLPQSETTAFKGWSGSTVGEWQQTIALKTVTYTGVTVQESNPGGGGPDTCWFAGSTYAPFTAITGGTWTVAAGNTWGFDYVGWFSGAVTYYRAQGRAPCGTTFPQQMQIQFATGDPTFYNYGAVNTLGGNIGTKTVTSIRAGKSKTEKWP